MTKISSVFSRSRELTYDSVLDGQALYLDGVPIASSNKATDAIPTATRSHAVGNGWLDPAGTGCTGAPINRALDELRVCDRVLAPGDVVLLRLRPVIRSQTLTVGACTRTGTSRPDPDAGSRSR
jgi:hypothetical protein